jgi:translocation and assembly module TamB
MIITLLSVIVLVSGALVAFLSTSEKAREIIASKLSALLSSEPDRKITIGKIEGLGLTQLKVSELTMEDREGMWLGAEDIIIRWSPASLLRAEIHIKEVGASLVRLNRMPVGGEEEKKEPSPITLPESLPPVTVEQLLVNQLVLGKSVAGYEATFRLEGGLAKAESEPGLKASLLLVRQDDAPATKVDISAMLHGEPRKLGVDVGIHEEANGWTAAVLNLDRAGPLDVSLRGDGPLSDWKGSLQGSVGKFGAIHSDVGIKIGQDLPQDITLALDGAFKPAEALISQQLDPVVGSENKFDIIARYGSSRFISVEKAEISGAGFHTRLVGSFDFHSHAVDGDLSFTMDELKALEPIAGEPLSGGLAIRAEVTGTTQQPQADISLQSNNLQIVDFRAEQFRLNLHAEPMAPESPSASLNVRIKGNGSVAGLAALEGKPLPESSLQWTLDIAAPSMENVSLDLFQIDGDYHHLELKGQGSLADPARLAGVLDAVLRVDDLKPLATFLGNELQGSGLIEAHLTGDRARQSASGNIQGFVSNIRGAPPQLAALLGEKLTFSGSMDLEEGARLNVPALQASSPVFRFDGGVHVNLIDNSLDGNWRLAVPKLAPVSPALSKSIQGSLEIIGKMNGPFSTLEHRVSLEGDKIILEGTELQQVHSEVDVRDVPKAPQGNLQLLLVQGKQQLEASSEFLFQGQELALHRIALDAPGNQVRGDLTVDLQNALAEGSLDGKFKNLAALGRFIGEKMEGSAELSAKLSHTEGAQKVKVNLDARNLSAAFGKVEKASLFADLENVKQTPRGDAKLSLQGLATSEAAVQTLNFNASGDARGGSFEGNAKGRYERNFDFQTKGDFQHTGDIDLIRLTGLKGQYGDYPLQLTQPVSIRRGTELYALDGLALSFGPARLQASGSLKPRAILFTAEIEKLPLEMASLFGAPTLPGTGAARVHVEGNPSQPSADVNISLAGLKPSDPDLANIPPTTVSANARLEGGRLNASAEIQGPFEKPATAALSTPVKLSLIPFSFALPPQEGISGRLDGQADLATLAALAPQEDHKLTGRLVIGFNLQGTVADPVVTGSANIENGSYLNMTSGTVLKDLTASLAATEQRLVIERLHATDGNGGTISGKGQVKLNPAENFPIDIDITFSNATLVRMDEATASAGGNVTITGTVTKMALEGDLLVRQADINIPKSIPPSVAKLDVVVINKPGEPPSGSGGKRKGNNKLKSSEKSKEEKNEETPSPFVLTLDVRVKSHGQIFVRGRGLDSEWEGDLQITGTAANPSVKGVIKVVRGNFDFLDNQFKLTQGEIRFHGETPPAPTLDVTTETEAKDITARLLITGTASNPNIELNSDPPLPQDEILSRILFDRKLDRISPLQALKLANALRALSGRGEGNVLDFFSNTRRFLGLEQLELRESSNGNGEMALGVGKYLTEDVYVDVEKGVASETGRVSVEVELHPNVTLDSEVGSEGSAGAGLNWKLDY